MRILTRIDRRMGVISVTLTRDAVGDGFDVRVVGELFDAASETEVTQIKFCIENALTKFSQECLNTDNHSTKH